MSDRPASPPVPAATAPCFSVSLPKFAVLWFGTLGLYGVYWFYRHWRVIKERERPDIIPVLRAVFQIFFCYSLFDHLNRSARTHDVAGSISAGALAAGFIVVSLLWRLPDPYWLVSFLGILFLLPAQRLANAVNARVAPQAPVNDRFSKANIAAIVLGGLLLALAVAGMLYPEDGAWEPAQRSQPTHRKGPRVLVAPVMLPREP